MQCHQCGTELAAGAAFCSNCGAATRPPAPTPTPAPQAKSNLGWIVALVAVALLGAAVTYIVVGGQDSAADTAAAETSDAEAETTAAPDTAEDSAPAEEAAPQDNASDSSVTNDGGEATPIASYVAYIGEADLYASDGLRLAQPWQVLRQDRANFYRYGVRDKGDEGDPFFDTAENRATMERMVMSGSIDPAAARRIVQGGVYVEVTIYGAGNRGDYLDVRVQ